MAEYKQVDLQIGTEAQFESKKETLPVGTIVGITDPIHKSELDSDLQTLIDSIANKLDKPSGNPTEDSFVKVSSVGSVSYFALSTLVDLSTEQILTAKKTWKVNEPGLLKTTDVAAGGIFFKKTYSGNTQSVTFNSDGVTLNKKTESNPIGDYTCINYPYLVNHSSDLYIFALAPDTVPTEPSVIVNATDRHVTWKPLSEFTSAQTFKTLFGNRSITGSGNIDLYKHSIKGVSGSSTFYLRIYSSNNLKVNSLTDLKTLLGSAFEESCTGSNGIMAITQDKVLFNDGTDASISGYTITDDVKTI